MYRDDIYKAFAQLPKEDGTYDDYYEMYKEHPQQDTHILARACDHFTQYVNFCMSIAIFYKSNSDGEYKQYKTVSDETFDYSDYKINLLHEYQLDIFNDTDLNSISYPNAKPLIRLAVSQLRYREIFNKLLDGESLGL